MNRETIIEAMDTAFWKVWPISVAQSGETSGKHPDEVSDCQIRACWEAALAAIEAAGVRLVYSGEAPAQLIDGDERTTVRIFTPYAPTSPGAITGIRKAEAPCSDCIDGWCQMNCGPRLT